MNVNLSVDKAAIFQGDEPDTIDFDNVTFVVDGPGNLKIKDAALNDVGYFPAGQWACVYVRTEED